MNNNFQKLEERNDILFYLASFKERMEEAKMDYKFICCSFLILSICASIICLINQTFPYQIYAVIMFFVTLWVVKTEVENLNFRLKFFQENILTFLEKLDKLNMQVGERPAQNKET